jgi:choline-sulfatase
MLEMLLSRWDPEKLKKNVITSQQRRLFIQKVLLTGNHTSWDYQPFRDAAKEYVRPAVNTNPTKTKALYRFPYKEPMPPDNPRS